MTRANQTVEASILEGVIEADRVETSSYIAFNFLDVVGRGRAILR